MDSLLFTPAALLDFLSQIEELKDYDLNVVETDSQLQVSIGESTYTIDTDSATDVPVDESVVDAVEDISQEAYENLDDDDIDVTTYEDDPIESGILKEIAKSLLLGGMVRLSAKLLK